MSLDLKHSALPKSNLIIRTILALLLGVGIPTFIAFATAPQSWSAVSLKSLYQYESTRETQIRELRQEEINQIRIALGRRVEGNRRADLYLRLSELYLEEYRSVFLLEGRHLEAQIQNGNKNAKLDRSQSKPVIKRGIDACEEVLRIGLNYPKVDQVYYFLGVYYAELDDRPRTLQYYQRIVNQFPDSFFAGISYAEIGFDAYTHRKFPAAEVNLKKAAELLDGPEGVRALHRLSWTYYRTRRYDQAVQALKKAIERATDKKDDKLMSLKEEALRDMAIFMTESGKTDEAIAYFKKYSGDSQYYARSLEKLARQYERNVQVEEAIKVLNSIIEVAPDSEIAFRANVKLIDIDLRKGKWGSVLKRLNSIKIASKGDEDTMTHLQNLKAMIRRTATESHDSYRKNKNKNSLERSDHFYTSYLDRILPALKTDSSEKEKIEIQMYLAEVKRERGLLPESASLYRAVIQSRDERYKKEATSLWTAVLAEQISAEKGKTQSKGNKPSDLETQFVDAVSDLETEMQDTLEGRELKLRVAQVLAAYPSTQKDSIKEIKKLVQNHPQTVQANVAARLWLQVLSDRLPEKVDPEKVSSDLVEDLGEAISEIRGNPGLIQNDERVAKGALRKQILELENRIRVLSIARFEKSNNLLSAAKGYEEFAARTDDLKQAEKALRNSFYHYFKSDDLQSAERVTQNWLKRNPKSKEPIDAWSTATTQAFIEGRFETAALGFERNGRVLKQNQMTESASRLNEALGNLEVAIRLGKNGSLFRLGKLYKKANRLNDAAKSWDQCLSSRSDSSMACGVELSQLHRLNADYKSEESVLKRMIQSKVKVGTHEKAYAYYRIAEIELSKQKFPPLSLPEASLQKGIADRLSFFKSWSAGVQSGVKLGGPWAISGLHLLARWSNDFAEEMLRIPSSVQEDSTRAAQLQKSVEQLSAPLRARAIQTWSEAIDRAEKEMILSPTLSEISDRLAALGSKKRFFSQGVRRGLKIAGQDPSGGSEGLDTALSKVRARLLKSGIDASAWADYGNLLWGQGYAELADLAYGRALAIEPNHVTALVNRAVVELSQNGFETPRVAVAAYQDLSRALKTDSFSLVAKYNLAFLLNYYRLYEHALPHWKSIIDRAPSVDVHLSNSIALLGLNKNIDASLLKIEELAGKEISKNIGYRFMTTALQAKSGQFKKCVSMASQLQSDQRLEYFERESLERLQSWCESKSEE